MAKKKELNEEAKYLTDALKVALGMSKDAHAVTFNGRLIAHTSVGTVFIPCSFDLEGAVSADALYHALKGCDEPYTISEVGSQVAISWGKRRAELPTSSKHGTYISQPDPVAAINVPENLSELLFGAVKDFTADSSLTNFANFLFFTNGAAFWTSGNIACMITTQLGMPNVLVYVKDVKSAMSYPSALVNIGGSAASLTFYFADGVCIQIPTVADSTVKYPFDGVSRLFQTDLYAASYPLTEEHLDAVEYVSKFAKDHFFIQPTHIGTHQDPAEGTAVAISDIPLDLKVRADLIKLGGFKRAHMLIKASNAANTVGFYTYRDNVTFCFVKVRG